MYKIQGDEFSERWAPTVIGVLRIVTALLFLEHGTAKLFGFPETEMGLAPAWSLGWIAAWIEVVGGLLLLVGLWTRWVAVLLAGEMAIAYWYAHAPQSFYPLVNGGDAAILFCFIFLTLAVIGAGEWSIDKMMARKRTGIEGYAAHGGERTFHSDE